MSLFELGLSILAVIAWPLIILAIITALDYMTRLLRRIEG